MLSVLFMTLFTAALANPVLINEQKPLKTQVVHGMALDFSVPVTITQFHCLFGAEYAIAFVRAYSPDGQGAFDPNSITNINNAYIAHASTEVYITPQPKSSKTAAQQLSEAYNGLVKGGVKVDGMWLQVVSPANWNNNYNSNIQFIQSFMNQLKVLKIDGGIFTSKNDWNAITNNWTGASSLALWYSNVFGPGLNGESAQNYNDFVSFGGWTGTPSAKQFSQLEAVCGVSPLNRDIYTISYSAKRVLTESEGPIVGVNMKV